MNNTSSSEICSSNTSTCANCGKGEEAGITLKSCTACKLVKYCSRECQIAHRPQHKKECKIRAKELHDEKLFKQPQPLEDCPICMMRLPTLGVGSVYMACCGKVICCGCTHAFQSRTTKKEEDICPFCRTPMPTVEETIKRYDKRIELNDAQAIHHMGSYYARGIYGLSQNYAKALEFYHRAGKLGHAAANYNIGIAYHTGNRGVEVDMKKTIHYWELAAMRGQMDARHNLGAMESRSGNKDRALKHYMIAVKDGGSTSLESIKMMYGTGLATKDEYTKALLSYQAYLDEIRSDQRDEAAALYSKYY